MSSENLKPNSESWMKNIDGDTLLSEISIPGTHDSAAWTSFSDWFGPFVNSMASVIPDPAGLGFRDQVWKLIKPLIIGPLENAIGSPSQDQNLNIDKQLSAGVRMFDLRLRRDANKSYAYHGVVGLDQSGQQVIGKLNSFLSSNPSEAILVSIKDENSDGISVHVPSSTDVMKSIKKIIDGINYVPEMFGGNKIIDWNPTDWVWKIPNHPDMGRQSVQFKDNNIILNAARGSSSAAVVYNAFATPENNFYTGNKMPTLDEVRGKLVLVNRYDTSHGIRYPHGTDGYPGSFKDGTNLSGVNWFVQDLWQKPTVEEKLKAVQDLIEKTTDEANWNNGDMAINFASAWDGNAKKYSDPINNYLRGLDSTGFVGVIMHDFIDAELAENVYLRNDQLFHGTSANEFIGGGYGDDKIFGGSGNDVIHGSLGSDELTGGEGADIFVYKKLHGNEKDVDIITDFDPAIDKIDFSSVDGDTEKNGFQSLKFVENSYLLSNIVPDGSTDYIVFNSIEGKLLVSNDKDPTPELEIILSGVSSFTVDSLIL